MSVSPGIERASAGMLRAAKRAFLMSALPVRLTAPSLSPKLTYIPHLARYRDLRHLLDASLVHAANDSHGASRLVEGAFSFENPS